MSGAIPPLPTSWCAQAQIYILKESTEKGYRHKNTYNNNNNNNNNNNACLFI
jgi:hypothetical protein